MREIRKITCAKCQSTIMEDFSGGISDNWKNKFGEKLYIWIIDPINEKIRTNFCHDCWKQEEKYYRAYCLDREFDFLNAFRKTSETFPYSKCLIFDENKSQWYTYDFPKRKIEKWDPEGWGSLPKYPESVQPPIYKQNNGEKQTNKNTISQQTLILSIIGTFIFSLILGYFWGRKKVKN